MLGLVVTFLLLLHAKCILPELSQESCNSSVYCQGKLLHTVQLAHIFEDSKTFVDLKMKRTENETINRFEEFMYKTHQNPSRKQIQEFVHKYFEKAKELEQWHPKDYHPNPKFLNQIKDAKVRDFAKKLVKLWLTLARRMKPAVLKNSEKYSFIPVPNGFFIPGGRFTEFYYWDSYWIIQGLLVSEMTRSVQGMIDNYISMVRRYGFVPTGGRIYYLNRSQPPFLALMAASYIKYTNDTEWLRTNAKYLDKELRWWLRYKLKAFRIRGKMYTLAYYRTRSGTPRPESYWEDIKTAAAYEDGRARQICYAELKNGAETGWDFSSRWIFHAEVNLTYIHTSRVIPVDLNSFLCRGFKEMANMYRILDDRENEDFWRKQYVYWVKTIKSVLWNRHDGIWYDYDLIFKQQRPLFFASNLSPLWAGCVADNEANNLGYRALNYLKSKGILNMQGGIPASLHNSGEQWDYPNAWAPLQAIVIQGLDYSGNNEAQAAAETLAKKWLTSNIRSYKATRQMYEKYNAEVPGGSGGGGEYKVQTGFGWTNGFALELIQRYFVNTSNVLKLN